MSVLKARLNGRGTDTEEAIQKRLTTAIKEIEYATSGAHDIVIVNDSLEKAYEKFEKVALGEDVQSDVLPRLLDSQQDQQPPSLPAGSPGEELGRSFLNSVMMKC